MPGMNFIKDAQVARLEELADIFNADLPMLKEFILPGGTRAAALAHLAAPSAAAPSARWSPARRRTAFRRRPPLHQPALRPALHPRPRPQPRRRPRRRALAKRQERRMSACVIGHITVKDEEKWAQYRAQVPATLAPWGAELLFRGSGAARLERRAPAQRSRRYPLSRPGGGRWLVWLGGLPGFDPAAPAGSRSRVDQL
jgi:hypothetical protein